MVAGAKLRRSQEELVRFRPYAERLAAITNRFLNAQGTLSHPLVDNEKSDPDAGLGKAETAPVGLILIGSDTGLLIGWYLLGLPDFLNFFYRFTGDGDGDHIRRQR